MGSSDVVQTCVVCNARTLLMTGDTAVLDAADAVRNGTLAHECGKCNGLFCLRCVLPSPVPGSRRDAGKGLTIAKIMLGAVAFACPKCGAPEVKVPPLDRQPETAAEAGNEAAEEPEDPEIWIDLKSDS